MAKSVKIADKIIGDGYPCFIIAEIGINHNGSVELAKKMIDTAVNCGCDAVKFQKRTIDVVYSKEELSMQRTSVFGETNGDLKRGLEFGFDEYCEIDDYCRKKRIIWFASSWDVGSVDFIERYNPPCHKISSACLTDDVLLRYVRSKGRPVLLSTGMSTIEEIRHAVAVLGEDDLIIYHCTSTYPTELEEINLLGIQTLKNMFSCPVGYSGHERGIFASSVAPVFGACSVERHITTDRTLWGSDQAASLEPDGLHRMVRDIRHIPKIAGDGKIVVYDSEKPIIKKLRKVKTLNV